MSDLPGPDVAAEGQRPACPDCRSAHLRPSKGSYPYDRERIGAGDGSFWRCNHCGARFLGPPAPTEQLRRRRHHRSAPRNPLDESIRSARAAKRWLFPILVILSTILVVVYILNRRDAPQPQIVLPG
jgi:ribosomal protein L37AE/L43A